MSNKESTAPLGCDGMSCTECRSKPPLTRRILIDETAYTVPFDVAEYISVARRALTFYGHPDNWNNRGVLIAIDHGEIARKALIGIKGQEAFQYKKEMGSEE